MSLITYCTASKHQYHFLICIFISIFLSLPCKSQIITRHSDSQLVNDSSSFSFDEDSVTNNVMTTTSAVIYYYNTLVYLTPYDTISHSTHIQRYFKDQLLEIYDEDKVLPASKIYGFRQKGNYYRSAALGNRTYVFAKRITSGKKMNLFSADRILAANELDVTGHDEQTNSGYANTMLVLDEDRKKIKKSDIDYFFTIPGTYDELQLLTPDKATVEKLQSCKPAADYLTKFAFPKRYKAIRISTRFLFISSVIVNVFFYNDLVHNPNYKNQSVFHDPLRSVMIYSGVAFLSTLFLPKTNKYTEKEIMKTVALFNSCN